MKLNKIAKIAGVFLASAVFFAGCSSSLSDSNEGYGSLTIVGDSRAIAVESIAKATVTVTGNGITTTLSKDTAITGGRASGITIEKIPVGKNRIITVQGKDASGNDIADALMMAVKDICEGNNSCEVTWSSSKKGYVYNALFTGNVNISELSDTEMTKINNAIPNCDATNINLAAFVNDWSAGSLKDSSAYILSSEKTLKRLTVTEASDSTAAAPKFTAVASYSDSTTADVTANCVWSSSKTSVATVSKGAVTLVAAGETVVTGSYTEGGVTKSGAKQTVTVTAQGGGIGTKIYFKPDTNWAAANAVFYCYRWTDGNKTEFMKMEASSDVSGAYEIDNSDGYENIIIIRQGPSAGTPTWESNWGKSADFKIPNDKDLLSISGSCDTSATGTWSKSGVSVGPVTYSATIQAEIPVEPSAPAVTITPAGSTISTSGSIVVSIQKNNADITSATVTIDGEVSKTYSYSDFTNDKLTISVKTLGITEDGKKISVSASATNSEGKDSKNANYTTTVQAVVKDVFTWDNVNCYFVLTDRFYNGDSRNDHSYYRKNAENDSKLASGYNNVATFHGGDIKGLTEKLDYLNNLGVNAIWITAPYEQAHGWCTGGGKGFPHYAFHGYYTQDWTYMDQNMGTIEEFRTFVNKAHEKGIRVVMDVVMNHTGYNTVEDMLTYDFGNLKSKPEHGWLGSGSWKDNHDITNYDELGNWGNWWGKWVRAFGDKSWGSQYFAAPGSGDITGSLAGLPDVVTERTEKIAIPKFLKTKWTNEADGTTVPDSTGNTCGNKYGDYKLPSVANADWNGKTGDWRTDNKGAPTDYQVMWLSAWVREFGVDGFRCDTAKHVDMYRWGQLKKACQSALEAWRKDSTKEDTAGAKGWDENFWMTGECFGWQSIAGEGDYYTKGGFDSMIAFNIGGSNNWDGKSYHNANISSNTWASYLNINKNQDSDNNGNRNNVLTYLSSHDTRLCRNRDQSALGTMFTLLPGGIQIYYGDESSRNAAYADCGDGDMATRGDMNFGENTAQVAHWGKVGTFRKYNPAVGAGTGSATKRTYDGAAGSNKVAISISGTTVDVSGLFDNGSTVYNWYDGKSATVSSGSVTFNGGTTNQPILVSDKNPADYGVTF